MKKVQQLEYHPFVSEEEKGAKPRRRTTNEKYREAVRSTQLIASQLAVISDEDEFECLLDFVHLQWRNVRQRMSVYLPEAAKAQPANASSHDLGLSQPELSQPHSLYSEEIGVVDAGCVQFANPYVINSS